MVKIAIKLMDNNSIVSDPNPEGTNPAFLYFDFDYVPRVGELVLLQDNPGGLYIVCAVVHEVRKSSGHPILIMEKYYKQTREEILRRYGWKPGDSDSTNAFEMERILIDN